jgi:NDP-sugar pyrophosphorylase family protein
LTAPIDFDAWLPSSADGIFSQLSHLAPWAITTNAEAIIRKALGSLAGYAFNDGVAIHPLATVERGATVKSPAIIGPSCLVASGAYLRGGVFLEDSCIVGPNCEVKSTFMLAGSKIAHLSFVGDSIIGARANVEAGAMIANYRNERADKRIRISFDGSVIDTGVDKFGALVGEQAKIGANAVIAPGALIKPGEIVPRLALVDQSP